MVLSLRNIFSDSSSALDDLNQVTSIAQTDNGEIDETTNTFITNKYGTIDNFYNKIQEEQQVQNVNTNEDAKRIEAVAAYNAANPDQPPLSDAPTYDMSKDSDVMYAANQPTALNQMQFAAGPEANVMLASTTTGEEDNTDLEDEKTDMGLLNALEGIVKMPYKTVLGLASGISKIPETISDPALLREKMNDPMFQIGMRMIQESGTPSFSSPFARLAKSVTDTGTYLDAVDAQAAKDAKDNDMSKNYAPTNETIDYASYVSDKNLVEYAAAHPELEQIFEIYRKAGIETEIGVESRYVQDANGDVSKEILNVVVGDKDRKTTRKNITYTLKAEDFDPEKNKSAQLLIDAGLKEGDIGTLQQIVKTDNQEDVIGYDWNTFSKKEPADQSTTVDIKNYQLPEAKTLNEISDFMKEQDDYILANTYLENLRTSEISQETINKTIQNQIDLVLKTDGPVATGKAKEALLPLALIVKSLVPEDVGTAMIGSLGFESYDEIDTLENVAAVGNKLTVSTAKELYPVSNKDIEFLKAQFGNIAQTPSTFVNLSAFHVAQGNYTKAFLGYVEDFKKDSNFYVSSSDDRLEVKRSISSIDPVMFDGQEFYNAKAYAEYRLAYELNKEVENNAELRAELEKVYGKPSYLEADKSSNPALTDKEGYSVMSILTAKTLMTDKFQKLSEKMKVQDISGAKGLFVGYPNYNELDDTQRLTFLQKEKERRIIAAMEDGPTKNEKIKILEAELGFKIDINASLQSQYNLITGQSK